MPKIKTPVQQFMKKHGKEKYHHRFFIAVAPETVVKTDSVMLTQARNVTEARKRFFAVTNSVKKNKSKWADLRVGLFQIVPVRGGGTNYELVAEWKGIAPNQWIDCTRSNRQYPLPSLTGASAAVKIHESAPKGNDQKKEETMPKTIKKNSAKTVEPKEAKITVTKGKGTKATVKPKGKASTSTKVAPKKSAPAKASTTKTAPKKTAATKTAPTKKAVATDKPSFTFEQDFAGAGEAKMTVRKFSDVKAAKTWAESQVTLKRGWEIVWEGQTMWVVDKEGNVPKQWDDYAVCVIRKGDHR